MHRKTFLPGNNGAEETKFVYDNLGQLKSYQSPAGVTVSYTYDSFGRLRSENHLDRGTTNNTYDLAGNLIRMANPETGAAGIQYTYDKGRLIEVTYPHSNHINGVKYTYGTTSAGNGIGRIVKVEQGGTFKSDDYRYDLMGNMIYEKKAINVPLFGDQEYTTEFSYDSWGRVLSMNYPDGEEVRYHYNTTGDLEAIKGKKTPSSSWYDVVTRITYNGYGQKERILYGNGTQTDFTYDHTHSRRLSGLELDVKSAGSTVKLLDKTFDYMLNINNISRITNNAPAVATGGLGVLMGGLYDLDNIQYDGMNQVESLTQKFGQQTLATEHNITMTMTYDKAGRISSKNLIDASSPTLNYSLTYGYGNIGQNNANNHITYPTPNGSSTNHRLEKITTGQSETYEFDYDDLGNIRQQVIVDGTNTIQKTDNYCWHENSTLKGWSNGDQSANGMAAHYVYDHTGERILKTLSLGGLATVNNSAQVIMAIESPTVYVNPYYVAIPYLQTQMVSKHYYMGAQRVASSMADVPSQIASVPAPGGGEGGEEFASPNLSSADDPVIIDFISTMNCVYDASIDLAFDESLSMPELDQINFHNCEGEEFPPEELAQEDPMCLCEQSVYWGNIYGADCSSRNVMYWYHPDYLGSVEAITDVQGEVYQFFHNTIWGEPLQDQKAFTYKDFSSRFRFNGKERDEETGNYYYGARYYDPKVSVWLSVDAMAAKRTWLTPYNFVQNNPLLRVDPDGNLDICETCPNEPRFDEYRDSPVNYEFTPNGNGGGEIHVSDHQTLDEATVFENSSPSQSKQEGGAKNPVFEITRSTVNSFSIPITGVITPIVAAIDNSGWDGTDLYLSANPYFIDENFNFRQMEGSRREIGIETMKATIGLISFWLPTKLTDSPPKYHPEEFLITTGASEGLNKVIDSTIGDDD